ncbi:hypothetical protein JL721_5847 [Aureococcus anophagefferens]|nr:hypothetical protein JL721_5847 [Aureococcus anophagefferens]
MAKPGERPKSDWAVPERLGGLKVERAEDDSGGVGGHVLMVGEAERIIENLKQFDIADVGSRAWMEQHASMEKLNQQAHAGARQWREKVYPYLEADIVGASEDRESEATRAKCMRCYFVLFHETTVVNLLECLCYHAHAVGNVRDASLDLTDYCARRLAALHSKAKLFRAAKPAKDAAQSPGDFARSLEKRSAKEELDQQSLEIEFSASVSCVARRMVAEHLGELTVAGMSRLLETHDFLLRPPRRFINDVLLDQLPVLADLQRFMDELAIVAAPEPTAVGDSGCLLQQVAAFHEAINRKADFEAVAKRQLETIWASADVASDDLKQLVEAAPDGENDARAANVAVPTTPPVALHLEGRARARRPSPRRRAGDAKVVAADDGATFLRRKWTLDGPVKCAGDDGLVLRVSFAGGVERRRVLLKCDVPLPGATAPTYRADALFVSTPAP